MKRSEIRKWIFGLILLGFLSYSLSGIETVARISDKEIIERLTRFEKGQKAILREMDKKFEAIDI